MAFWDSAPSNDDAFKHANYEIIQPMFNELSQIINGNITSNFQVIMQLVSPLFATGVVLAAIFFAWEVLYSDKDDVMMDIVKRLGVLTLVCGVTVAGGMYLSHIVPFVQNSGQEVAAKLIGQDGASTGAVIDGLINRLIDLGVEQFGVFKSTEGWFDSMGAWIIFCLKAIILFIAGGGFVIYAAAYLLMAEMMVGILLSLGGVFIFFAAFSTTRNMFTAWVGSCFNYIFLNIAYACLFKVLITYINTYITGNKDGIVNQIWGVLCVSLVFAIGKFLLSQIATLVSTLTGGVGINGLTRETKNMLNSARGTANKAREQLGLGFSEKAAKNRERNSDIAGKVVSAFTGGGKIKAG